jgi:hypothetical protein
MCGIGERVFLRERPVLNDIFSGRKVPPEIPTTYIYFQKGNKKDDKKRTYRDNLNDPVQTYLGFHGICRLDTILLLSSEITGAP